MQIFTNNHKKKLSKWYMENNSEEFFSALKLQKFLFLYEMYSEIENQSGDFSSLKAYEKGPVYSDVWSDYTYRKSSFLDELNKTELDDSINYENAIIVGFLTKILSEEDLSDLTHELNIWKIHEPRLELKVKHIPMQKHDISFTDIDLLSKLKSLYSTEFIKSHKVLSINDKNFVISHSDFEKMTDEHKRQLFGLAEYESENPIYLEMGEDGVLLID